MATEGIQFANHFRTLERQRITLERLAAQIAKYQPRLTKTELRRREAAKRRIYRLNSDQPRTAIDRMVNEMMFHPDIQWHRRFGQRVQDAWLVIVLVSAAVVEELINGYLALRCATAEKADLFEDFEKLDLMKKWVVLPGVFVPNYSFPKTGSLYYDLKSLSQTRNALAHPKITYVRDGTMLLKGTDTRRRGYERDIKFLRGCCTLPNRLVEHLRASDDSDHIHHWLESAVRPAN
jgi:hypothetical protein